MELNNVLLSADQVALIDGGEWVDDLQRAEGLRLRVRGMNSDPVQKAIQKEIWDLRASKGGAGLSDEEIDKCQRVALAKAALLEWDGLTDNGVAVPYDRQKAIDWLTPETGRVFAEFVKVAAWRITAKGESLKEAALKNSQPASVGHLPTLTRAD